LIVFLMLARPARAAPEDLTIFSKRQCARSHRLDAQGGFIRRND
jgi:hypothetical protein